MRSVDSCFACRLKAELATLLQEFYAFYFPFYLPVFFTQVTSGEERAQGWGICARRISCYVNLSINIMTVIVLKPIPVISQELFITEAAACTKRRCQQQTDVIFIFFNLRLNKTRETCNLRFRLLERAPTREHRHRPQAPYQHHAPRSSCPAVSEPPPYHADAVVHMSCCDQRGERGQHHFFCPAQQPRDGCVDHQRQGEQEPVEQLGLGAAHLADDDFALWEQRWPGEKQRVVSVFVDSLYPFSLWVVFDGGKKQARLQNGACFYYYR